MCVYVRQKKEKKPQINVNIKTHKMAVKGISFGHINALKCTFVPSEAVTQVCACLCVCA